MPNARNRFAMALLAAVMMIAVTNGSLAQEATDDKPIYLEEPRQPPPVKEVRHREVKRNYADDTIRLEFKVLQLSDDTFVNDGQYTEYYPDGQKFQQGKFERGAYVGQWSYWHPNGKLCKQVTFKESKPDGQWEVFRSDGTKSELQTYSTGRRDGQWVSYYPDGETPMAEFTYLEGEVTGTRTSYHENGKKKQEIHFKGGKMHGMMTEWDETGKKTAELEFDNGKRKGDVIRY